MTPLYVSSALFFLHQADIQEANLFSLLFLCLDPASSSSSWTSSKLLPKLSVVWMICRLNTLRTRERLKLGVSYSRYRQTNRIVNNICIYSVWCPNGHVVPFPSLIKWLWPFILSLMVIWTILFSNGATLQFITASYIIQVFRSCLQIWVDHFITSVICTQIPTHFGCPWLCSFLYWCAQCVFFSVGIIYCTSVFSHSGIRKGQKKKDKVQLFLPSG